MKLKPKYLVPYLAAATTASVLLGITPKSAFAASLTWTLQNVTFSDGGTATGTFDYDATTGVYTNWNISVSGGDTPNLTAFTYNPTSSNPSYSPSIPSLELSSNELSDFDTNGSRQRQLRLPFLTLLTDAGGTISLDSSNLPSNLIPLFGAKGIECWNCFPFRFITGGQVVARAVTQVPESNLGKFTLVSLLSLGLLTRYQSRGRREKLAQ
ncbi:hypothetical protein [Nostoc sp. TCL26-01]|uniref:hypothetical protein n=1 Tax=Nostoc sp. TCL26-01 TaxID=2576904 RepID=UPI0015BC10CC|nr:hypothetical protein [Nostoc sp. TCL26-01]QLE55738.1 hypothetical protein FD725_09540 [Nostoc sp. TCL26-01]